MVKNIFLFVAVLMLVIAGAHNLQASFGSLDLEKSDVPVVAELFTSQSCSSCPPADQALEQISAYPHVIALSCHVTYWNHLHWQDTLSHEFCTQRQHAIAALRGSGRVYTPQMVVNGGAEFVGSRRGQIAAEIDKAAREHAVRPIILTPGENGAIDLTLPDLDAPGDYAIWVFGTLSRHEQAIPSGENSGRQVVYVNAAQNLQKLDPWDGKGQIRSVFVKGNRAALIDGVVVIAQKNGFGAVVAAGKLPL